MISTEVISNKIRQLPIDSRQKVLDFIDALVGEPAKMTNTERARAWEEWARGHSPSGVLVDDRREYVYED